MLSHQGCHLRSSHINKRLNWCEISVNQAMGSLSIRTTRNYNKLKAPGDIIGGNCRFNRTWAQRVAYKSWLANLLRWIANGHLLKTAIKILAILIPTYMYAESSWLYYVDLLSIRTECTKLQIELSSSTLISQNIKPGYVPACSICSKPLFLSQRRQLQIEKFKHQITHKQLSTQ